MYVYYVVVILGLLLEEYMFLLSFKDDTFCVSVYTRFDVTNKSLGDKCFEWILNNL